MLANLAIQLRVNWDHRGETRRHETAQILAVEGSAAAECKAS
ncbi:hypothetical protein SAMN05444580_101203 [Rhodococcus tukisamuensis]|uniref:Uncharacterized protein n=1 Tax=Rhodococcus tukisamuensis TaxID=168276 RepID=A0A1G6MK45_9NOCA|nr:hypothetical protein SAMN05444580_101203 [Rhodococcus tukisamuensis]